MPVGRINQSSSDKPGQTRTVFRPPWVKESESTSTTAPGATKTTPPWAKKTSTATTPAAPEPTPAKTPAATTSTAKATTKTPVPTATKTPAPAATKTPAPATNATSKVTPKSTATTKANGTTAANPTAPVVPIPAATPQKNVKLQSREIKVPVITEKPKPIQSILKPVQKDQKVTKTPEQIEKELEEKFKLEKPKLRPVVMKTKSYAARKEKEAAAAAAAALAAKKVIEEEEESSEEEETESEEESEEEESEEEEEEEEEEKAKARFKIERPQLRHVVINKQKSFNKSVEEFDKIRPVLKKVPKVDESKPPAEPEKPIFKDIELKKVPPKPSVPAPPPPPPPGLAPPPPPPPVAPPTDFSKTPLTDKQKKTLEKLKSRPRRRPDWSDMMKEVEGGKKLKHVQCNDRSKPILTCKSVAKVDGQFVFETEKQNKASDHNKMLKEIQGGIKLKPTKTNDRSKPILEGLRKFRRQMTIEEQIQKSESKAQLNQLPAATPVEVSEDEMDDIDKLRDDLQSTKQMLALELRNKEAQERENKRLSAKIANLEAELENEKQKIKTDGIYGDGSVSQEVLNAITKSATDENLVKTLKKDAEDARKESKLLEKKYQEAAEQLDQVRGASDEQKRKIIELEKKLSLAIQGLPISTDNTRRQSTAAQKESSPELELEESESDEDEDDEKKAERKIRRLAREVKFLRTKLTKLLDKEVAAKKERANLKEAMKKNQILLKQETKKFKKLEKEVGKMAASMAGDEDDEDKADENGEDEAEEEEEEEVSEEESESEESEEESESETESESEPEDASDDDKKSNLEPRVKRHEGRLAALKKGNFLLQTNVDRLQDEINLTREKAVSLQAELDAVIADLGF